MQGVAPESLERETYSYAHRVAEQSLDALRFIKIQANKHTTVIDEWVGIGKHGPASGVVAC